MNRITIWVNGSLKKEIGKEEILVDAQNVKEVFEKLKDKFGDKFIKQLYEKEKIRSYYMFLLNGHFVETGKLNQTKLSPGDVLRIFQLVAGG